MSKHTPGPWIISNDIDEEGFADIESKNGPLYIRVKWCQMPRPTKAVKEKLREEMRVNASLIISAPDLLALLLESQESIGGDWRARRDAAIVKATSAD